MSGSEQASSGGTVLLQALLIVVGWYVVHVFSARRDRDKSRRELAAKVADMLSERAERIFQQALEYHCKDRTVGAELRLKSELQDLALQLAEVRTVCPSNAIELTAASSAVAALRRAITAKHFEDEHDEPLPSGHQQLSSIADAALDLKRRLAKLKFAQFPA